MGRRSRPRRTPEGFHYVGNRLVPNEGTTYNEETESWDTNPTEPQKSILTSKEPEGRPEEEWGGGYGFDDDGGGSESSGGSGQPDIDQNDEDENPHWSSPEVGGGGIESSPGIEETPSFDETIKLHKEEQLATALSNRDADMAGKSVGGGYGKKRKAEVSRGQMNLTSGSNRSILTS